MPPLQLIEKKIVIIGAGFGGLGMGVALKNANEHDFVILEKYSNVGGVWRDNTYPGCTCDVPSHLYSFSFARYKSTKQRYPPQQAILEYLQQVALDYRLTEHVNLNAGVLQAQFRQEESRWEISTEGRQYRAEIVIFAVGQLHEPNYPLDKIPGEYTGMHSARWDSKIELHGKRISVVGTGSSAAQMIPELAKVASKVTIYQRTPHWVLPKPNASFHYVESLLLQIPGAHQLYRRALSLGADLLLSPLARSHTWSRIVEGYAKRSLRRQVDDKELVSNLTPSYPIGSKRIVFDNGYYRALQRDNVQLVSEPIKSIGESGIETESGAFVETDLVILATGFRASEFLVPIKVRGREERSLQEDWKAGAKAFMGLAIHGYPNLFMLAGPNSFNPAGSNPQMKELQIAYIMRCLRWKDKVCARSVEVSQEATIEYHGWLAKEMEQTVWATSIDSWYRHGSGQVTNPWPASARVFARKLRRKPKHSFTYV